MKTCTKCGETKPLEEFHKQSKTPDGHRARCKTCLIAEERARRARRDPAGRARTDEQRARRREAKRRARRKAGVKPQQIGRSPLCTWATCKRAGLIEGLCEHHYHEVTKGDESPLDVGAPTIKSVGGVRRWVA